MSSPPRPPLESDLLRKLLQQARQGNAAAIDQLMSTYREYVRQVVQLRLEPRVRRREDSSDVIQEALLRAAHRLADFFERQPMPFSLWIRRTAQECLADVHRRHVENQKRCVFAEVRLPKEMSVSFLLHLVDKENPVKEAMRHEAVARLTQAMAQLDYEDREVILLRIFEQLSNVEASTVLGLQPSTTSKRYTRALLRLRQLVLQQGLTESR